MQSHNITQPLYIPIDVGKNVHSYGAYVGPQLEPVVVPQEIRTHRPAYEQFRTWLTQQIAAPQYAPIIVGLEPTGVYHEAWAHALHRDVGNAVQIHIVNPFRTRQKRRQLQNRAERKTDAVDVEALAHCLRDGNGQLFSPPGFDLQSLHLWCKRHHLLKRDYRRLANRIRGQMDRLWPGALVDVRAFKRAHPSMEPPAPLVKTQPLRRKLVRTVLRIDPNPYMWRALSQDHICTTLRQAGMPCGPKTAHKVQRVAQEALLPPPDTAQLLAEQAHATFQRYEQLCAELDDLRARAEALLCASPGAVVATVPGISEFLAACYVGLLADVRRFDHADQVWAYVGFDIVQHDSGDRRQRGHITKRGQPYGRAVLYDLGFWASKACRAIGHARRRALRRGKTEVEAVIHAAHKTNRICFHLYKHGVPFDPAKSR